MKLALRVSPLALVLLVTQALLTAASPRPPNVVIIYADDLGYGDLGCYGHPSIATPNLDRMAAEGQRWTDFYSAAPVCAPSRAALLTGRYPVRSGTHAGVFFEWSADGLPPAEATLAEVLSAAGYATACVGKWHLGHQPQFLPGAQGFDSYFGIPYSNDMRIDRTMKLAPDIVLREGMTLERLRARGNKVQNWVPLMEDDAVVEYPCDQTTLTRRYTERCLAFIRQNHDRPFFLYYAQAFPHVPLFASGDFRGRSRRGLYGDVVEEMDHSVGQILRTLRETGLAENTVVVFTSDNGPWLSKGTEGGSAGLLRGGKGQTFDGGMRVPAIFWAPGRIPGGRTVRELGSTLDLFATLAAFSGAPLPKTALDSHDLSPALLRAAASPREVFFFYRGAQIYAVRQGPWKAHFIIEGSYGMGEPRTELKTPLLYHLDSDPSEAHDVAKAHPEIVARLLALRDAQEKAVTPAPDRYAAVTDHDDLPAWAKRPAAK